MKLFTTKSEGNDLGCQLVRRMSVDEDRWRKPSALEKKASFLGDLWKRTISPGNVLRTTSRPIGTYGTGKS
jgi:hypothetical protein